MKKHLLLLACLALPLASMAASAKPAGKPPAAAASAAAPAAAPIDSRAAVRASKVRSSAMGVCLKKASDQNLAGLERKQFVAACVNGK